MEAKEPEKKKSSARLQLEAELEKLKKERAWADKKGKKNLKKDLDKKIERKKIAIARI